MCVCVKLVFHWRKISYFSFTYSMYIEISRTYISISVTVYFDKEHQKKVYAETSCEMYSLFFLI